MNHPPRRRRSGDPIAHDPEAVRQAREAKNMSKRALAEAIGISEQLMGQIESGERNATPPNLAKLEEVLGRRLSAEVAS